MTTKFTTRTTGLFALFLALSAPGIAWAETESALHVNVEGTTVTIANYDSSSRLDQSNNDVSNAKIRIASGLHGDLVDSGMRVRVDYLELVRDYKGTDSPSPQKIRLVVDGVTHTSDAYVETSLSLYHRGNSSYPVSYGRKYVFSSTPYLKVGQSYDVSFLDASGNVQNKIRYEVVNNSADLISGIATSGWRPAYKMTGTIISTVTKATSGTITSADSGNLLVLNGGTVNVSGSAAATGLIVSGGTTLHFEAGATLTLSGPLYVESGNTLTLSSADTISGSQTFITAGGVCATAGAIVSSDASHSASVTSTTVALTSYSNDASVSGEVNWSSIVWDDGTWHANSPTTLTLTDNATINFDNTYSMSSLTLTGAHAVTLVYTKTPTVSGGIICENSATCSIKIPATGTDWPIGSSWTVPNDGITYILVGNADSNSPTGCSGQITVNGKLETSGYLNLSAENKIATTGALRVLDGRTKMTVGGNANGICGTLTVEAGAAFENVTNDGLHYGGSPTVNVYGTLDMASTRWTLGGSTLNFYAGSTITGVGELTYGALDSNSAKTFNILANPGHDTVNLGAKLRPRKQQTFNIAAAVTVNCTGTVSDYQEQINITGSGTFKIATGASFPSGVPFNVETSATLELAGGTISDAVKGSGNLSVSSGAYEPTFSSFTGAISVSGSGTVLTLSSAQVTASSGISVGADSTLKIMVTDEQIERSGFDASAKVSNSGGTVMFVNSSGTQITENVSVDGETLSAAKVWGAGSSGNWDVNANWAADAAPSARENAILGTAGATITVSASSAAKTVYVDESTTIAGAAAALQAFAENLTSIVIASGKTLTLSCTDDGTYDFNVAIGGDGALAVSHGTVTFKQENTFTGGLTVKQGGTLVKGDGVKRFGPDGRSITVEVGGTLDLNKTSVQGTGVSYAITIVEGDSSVWETTPVLTNTGDSLGTSWKQTSSITVRANATIECNSNHNWGLLASSYGTSRLKIGKDKTLRKVGGGEFWLTNVTLSNLDGDSGSGDAVLKIVEGSANVINQGPSYSNSLSSGALFKVEVVGGSLEVNKDFTISTLSHQGGSVNIAADKTLTVPSINVAANATMSPSGTIACNGDMTIGGTVTVPADKTWTIGNSANGTSDRSGVLTVQSGGRLEVNGRINIENMYAANINTVIVENGGTLEVTSTGNLYQYSNYWSMFRIRGDMIVAGALSNYGDLVVESTGALTVSGAQSFFNVYDVIDKGTITFDGRIKYLTSSGYKIKVQNSGKMVFVPADTYIGVNISEWMTNGVDFGSTTPTMYFDVSNLSSKPTGTSATTLVTTSTSLTLTADSLTGCSTDYYVKQDGTTGAVTLQLHAAKDSDGVYYDDVDDALDAIVDDHSLTVTILDGTAASYNSTITAKGLFLFGTQVKFLAAERLNGDSAVLAQYATVQAAVDAADEDTFIKVYVSASVTSTRDPLYVLKANDSIDITVDYSYAGKSYGEPTLLPGFDGVYAYHPVACETTFTWNTSVPSGYWNEPSNWISEKPVAAIPDNALYRVVLGSDATVTLQSHKAVYGVQICATVKLDSPANNQTLTVGAGGIVLASASAQLKVYDDGNAAVYLSKMPTTSVEGKYVTSAAASGYLTVYSLADAKATVYDAEDNVVNGYDSLADAVAAALDGQKVKMFANSSEAVTLNDKSITFDEGDYTFSGSLTGNGTIKLTALLKSAGTARWANPGWTGTVVLPTLGSIAGDTFSFNDYGISGSTVRVTTIGGGWVKKEPVNPTIDIETRLALTDFSAGSDNIFSKITGRGTLSLSCNASSIFVDANNWYSNYSAYFLVNDMREFSGSVSVTNLGLAIGDRKPPYRTPGGKIILNSGKEATVGASKSWTASTIQLGGALSVAEGGTLSGDVEILNGGSLESTSNTALTSLVLNDGATIVFPTSSSALTGITSLTFVSGTTYISFPNGAPDSGTIIDWSSVGSAPAGSFVLEGAAAETHILAKGAAGLSIAKGVASVTTTSRTTPYSDINRAIHGAVSAGEDLLHITILADGSITVPLYATTMNIKNVGGATITIGGVTAEYEVSSSTAGDMTTYIVSNVPTEYTWTDGFSNLDSSENHDWIKPGNWQYGIAQDATRFPQAGDTVIFNDGATVELTDNASVSGVTVTGAMTLTAESACTLTVSDDIDLADDDATLAINSYVTLSETPTTSVDDMCVVWETESGIITYSVVTPVAQIDAAYYGSLANAINAAGDANLASITVLDRNAPIPSGYAIVTTAGGEMSLRTAGNGELVYWGASNSGDWSGEDSNETHVFYTNEGATTPYVVGDTVVITNNTYIWSKTAAHGAKFQIGTLSQTADVKFARSGDHCNDYILDGSTVEVVAGSKLIVQRYADNGWNSYGGNNPQASYINDTSIIGGGTFKIGRDATVDLSGTSTIASTVAIEFDTDSVLKVGTYGKISASTLTLRDGSRLEFGDPGSTSTAFINVDTTVLETVSDIVTIGFASGVTPAVGAKLISWSSAPAGTFQLESSLISSYALLSDASGLSIVTPVANIVKVVDAGTQNLACFSSAQEAVRAVITHQAYFAYDYIAVQSGNPAVIELYYDWVGVTSGWLKIKGCNGATVDVRPQTEEYEVISGEPEDDVVAYTYVTKPTVYTWVGLAASDNAIKWRPVRNWQYGEASVATRYPGDPDTLDAVRFVSNAEVTIPQNLALASITNSAVVSISKDGDIDRTITAQVGGIVLSDADASISVTGVTLSPRPTTSVAGKVVKWVTADGTTTYTVADPVAQIGAASYGSLANAIEDAVNGETITLLADCPESVSIGGKSLTFNEGAHTFTGSFSGTGSLTVSNATIANGNTWSATGGITLAGTLVCGGTGTFACATTISGTSARIVLTNAQALVVGNALTFAEGARLSVTNTADLTLKEQRVLISGITPTEALAVNQILSNVVIEGHPECIVATKANSSDSSKIDIVACRSFDVTCEDTTEDTTTVSIPGSWVANNVSAEHFASADFGGGGLNGVPAGVKSDLVRAANGCVYLESYALGLTPSNAASVPAAGLTVAGEGDDVEFELFLTNAVVPTGVNLTISVEAAAPGGEYAEVVDDKNEIIKTSVEGNGTNVSDSRVSIPVTDAAGTQLYRLKVKIAGT